MVDEFEAFLQKLRDLRAEHEGSQDKRVQNAFLLLGPMLEIIEGEGNSYPPLGRNEDG